MNELFFSKSCSNRVYFISSEISWSNGSSNLYYLRKLANANSWSSPFFDTHLYLLRTTIEIQEIIRSKYSRHSRFTHSSILNIHIKYYICITLRFFLAFPRLDIFPCNYYRSRYQLRRNVSSKILILVQRTSARADGHVKKKKEIGERNEGISLTEITRERKRET